MDSLGLEIQVDVGHPMKCWELTFLCLQKHYVLLNLELPLLF